MPILMNKIISNNSHIIIMEQVIYATRVVTYPRRRGGRFARLLAPTETFSAVYTLMGVPSTTALIMPMGLRRSSRSNLNNLDHVSGPSL